MSDCDEVIPVTESRKKRRTSSFRFSSKRVLNRSRLKRLSKARGCEVTSITMTLSYPGLIPSEVGVSENLVSVATTCKSLDLLAVQEFEEEREETANVDLIKDSEMHKTVRSFSLFSLRIYF